MRLFPYDKSSGNNADVDSPECNNHFWRYRRTLKNRMDFGNYIEDRGLRWFDHSMFFPVRFRNPLSIPFSFVATHNHFVLDRGGKVFNRSAPMIKLTPGATEDDHLALLGLLNSSTACFWMKQVFFRKGETMLVRRRTRPTNLAWENFTGIRRDGPRVVSCSPGPSDRPCPQARRSC